MPSDPHEGDEVCGTDEVCGSAQLVPRDGRVAGRAPRRGRPGYARGGAPGRPATDLSGAPRRRPGTLSPVTAPRQDSMGPAPGPAAFHPAPGPGPGAFPPMPDGRSSASRRRRWARPVASGGISRGDQPCGGPGRVELVGGDETNVDLAEVGGPHLSHLSESERRSIRWAMGIGAGLPESWLRFVRFRSLSDVRWASHLGDWLLRSSYKPPGVNRRWKVHGDGTEKSAAWWIALLACEVGALDDRRSGGNPDQAVLGPRNSPGGR